MEYSKAFDSLVIQFPEDKDLANDGVMNEGEISTRLGLAGIPSIAEVIIIERDLRLVEATGAKYHVSCVSTSESVDVIRNNHITDKEIIKKKYNKIVISPGPGNPNQSGNCIKIVKSLHKKIPILGVCLGHQIIGQVFGSKIIQASKLMHGKTSKIKSKKIGILKNISSNFEATRYHSLIIDKKTLSKDLEITADTEDGIIMGIKH